MQHEIQRYVIRRELDRPWWQAFVSKCTRVNEKDDCSEKGDWLLSQAPEAGVRQAEDRSRKIRYPIQRFSCDLDIRSHT